MFYPLEFDYAFWQSTDYSGVTSETWLLRAQATRLFVQQTDEANMK